MEVELFPCYSPKLMKFLTEVKKIRYKLVALNHKSKKTMWIFIGNEQLKDALTEWHTTNPN